MTLEDYAHKLLFEKITNGAYSYHLPIIGEEESDSLNPGGDILVPIESSILVPLEF